MAWKDPQSSTFSRTRVKSTVFFDIETTTRYKTFEEYAEKEPFNAKEFIRIREMKYPEYAHPGKTIGDIYKEYGMLHPEHGQIVSIAYKYKQADNAKFESEIFGFKSWEEYEAIEDKKHADRLLLLKFNMALESMFGDNDGMLGGYRIKLFDISYLVKRMMASRMLPHKSLLIANKKPWEIIHLDLYDYWNVGANGMCSLGLICDLVGTMNPKDEDMAGHQVAARFWEGHAIDEVNDYCLRDVDASLRLAWELTEESLREGYEQQKREWLESDEARLMQEEANEKKRILTEEEILKLEAEEKKEQLAESFGDLFDDSDVVVAHA